MHADRPLVCRLYPLGKKMAGEGQGSFRYAIPHLKKEGVYGHDGTVEDFLTAQGVARFFQVHDRKALVR